MYKIKEVKGVLEKDKLVESLILKKNGQAEIIYLDTIIRATWKEIDIQELNYIELTTGEDIYELDIMKNSTIELYFVSNASNFRGSKYDSLTYVKVK